METIIKVKYAIGFVLYTLGLFLFLLSTLNLKIFFSVAMLSVGILLLVEAYHTEEKHD
jgi:hypothetical protein